MEDVCDFLRDIPGYEGYVGAFTDHEINGEALLALEEEKMVKIMKLKLGKVAVIKDRAAKHKPDIKEEVIDLDED